MSTARGAAASVGDFTRRSDLTNTVIDEFAKEYGVHRGAALNTIAKFIETQVLAPEEQWNSDPVRTEEGLATARDALLESLTKLNEIVSVDKISEDDVNPIAAGIFLAVIKYEWNCPFPLYFC